ncbi:Biotin/lipoate A/B protein ligase [Pseudocyphellaria aurata]|nr:Biotin/lipoate A/B protein ligase [Pseudocyphellaria aurata]
MRRWKSRSSIWRRPCIQPVLIPFNLFNHAPKHISSFGAATFAEVATKKTSKYQIYFSRISDPYVNLSVEHFLLQNTPPDSTVLLLYVNSPCVVIGRNQNPWLETDLRLMQNTPVVGRDHHGMGYEHVQLVRRRSGGGTVFHDYGNVNYSVICPTQEFSRDKHAEMVTRVLRNKNPRAHVNDRHDIVLDQGSFQERGRPDPTNLHPTGSQCEDISPAPLKVSGSAYKLTRQRSLHHGTCLLASPNLEVVSNYLRSPARPFMKARGVDSVRSPIGNVYDEFRKNSEDLTFAFQRGVADSFAELYGLEQGGLSPLTDIDDKTIRDPRVQCIRGYVEEDVKDIPDIECGIKELKSLDWIFGQTPQFIVSSHPSEEDDRPRPPLPSKVPPSARVYLKVRSGIITSSRISISSTQSVALAEAERFGSIINERKILNIGNFERNLNEAGYHEKAEEVVAISSWLDRMFGFVDTSG